jgi:hypothetical protein
MYFFWVNTYKYMYVNIYKYVCIWSYTYYIYVGERCGLLSANGDSSKEDESFYTKRKSQLNVIFSVLGTPSEQVLISIYVYAYV